MTSAQSNLDLVGSTNWPTSRLEAGETKLTSTAAPSHRLGGEGRQIRTAVYHSWEQLEKKVPEWEIILRENSKLSIFSTPEWLGSWWKAFGSEKQMLALAFSNEGGELLGLAPFYVDAAGSRSFARWNLLRLVGDGSEDSDNLELVVKPGYENACAEAFLDWLSSTPDWHLCVLNTLPSDSTVANALLRALKSRGWKFTVTPRPGLRLDLPDQWDEYLARLSTNQRSKVRNLRRRLEKAYDFRIFKCANSKDLPACLEALFELHQRRWQMLEEPGTFASAARRRFYFQMARSFLDRKWLEFWFLEVNGKPVAAQFGFRYRDTVYHLQEGFDPDFAVHRAGFVLRSYVLERLISEGVRCYDFLAGLGNAKEHWGTRPGNYSDLHFAKPWTCGAAYLALVEKASQTKTWLRRHFPAWAWNSLRILNRAAKSLTQALHPDSEIICGIPYRAR